MRKKAWERADDRGFVSEVASFLELRPQTVRRWFLEPDHPDRRELRDNRILSKLGGKRFDLQPADFFWQRGERAARKRAQAEARAAA